MADARWLAQLRDRLEIEELMKEHFEAHGPFEASALRRLEGRDCARLFEQDPESAAGELMELFARALRDLGAFLEERHRTLGVVLDTPGNLTIVRPVERRHA